MKMQKKLKNIAMLKRRSTKYTKLHENFGKYFKCVTVCGKSCLRNVFVELYKNVLQSEEFKNIQNLFCNALGWSNSKFRSVFNTQERKIFDDVANGVLIEGDITLYYKLIVNIVPDLPDTLKVNLRFLKNLRNKVCHEDIEINDDLFAEKIHELIFTCKNIIHEINAFIGKDFSYISNEIETDILDIAGASLNSVDIANNFNEIDCFKSNRQALFIIRARDELMKSYASVKSVNPYIWSGDSKFLSFSFDNIFTMVKLQTCDTLVEAKDIFRVASCKERFFTRVIIITGNMGCGKSCLCKYFVNEWRLKTSEVNLLHDFDIVLFLVVRNIASSSLSQYLKEQLLKVSSRSLSDDELIPFLQDINILFIIDGADEAGIQGKLLLKEILTKFTESRIVITSRPEYVIDIMHTAADHITFNISGFDEVGLYNYVSKVLSIIEEKKALQEQKKEEFFKYLKTLSSKLGAHLKVPLISTLLLLLWYEDSTSSCCIKSATNLYDKIICLFERKLALSLSRNMNSHFTQILLQIKRWVLHLGKVALEILYKNVLIIDGETANSLIDYANYLQVDPIYSMSTFLTCEVSDSVIGPKYEYSFVHASLAEFLAAQYIVSCVIKTGNFFPCIELEDPFKFKNVIYYVTGLLSNENKITSVLAYQIKTILLNILHIKADAYTTWLELIIESNWHDNICSAYGEVLSSSNEWCIIDSKQSIEERISFLKLLESIEVSSINLSIELDFMTKLSDMPELQKIFGPLSSKITKIKICFESQFFYQSDKECCDLYMLPFLVGDKIVELKGHVGLDFCQNLDSAFCIESLAVRISSVDTLEQLARIIRKRSKYKRRLFFSRKWKLKYLEILLDFDMNGIDNNSTVYLNWSNVLVIRLCNVSDSDAVTAGITIKKINFRYNVIILQESSLTPKGLYDFLQEVRMIKIKKVQVMTNSGITNSDMFDLRRFCRAEIAWGGTVSSGPLSYSIL